MIFNQIEFVLLMVGVLLFHALVRNQVARRRFLLLTSYYFYGYWDWRFLGLMSITITVDYLVARAIHAQSDPVTRKRLLLVSLIVNLGILGFVKYFNFFIASATPLLQALGLHPHTLNLILPVGISFFGRAWSEPLLIEIAYSYEQGTKFRKAPQFLPTLPFEVVD